MARYYKFHQCRWLYENTSPLTKTTRFSYYLLRGCLRGHPLSTYAKFSEKLTFLTLWYGHVYVRIKGLEMLVFRKILRTYLMDDPLGKSTKFQFGFLIPEYGTTLLMPRMKKYNLTQLWGLGMHPRAQSFIRSNTWSKNHGNKLITKHVCTSMCNTLS